MTKKQKFENFLENLKGNGQDTLIENVKKGFQACYEAFGNEQTKEIILNWFRGPDNYKTNPFPLGQLVAGDTKRTSGIFKPKGGPKTYYHIQEYKWDEENKTHIKLDSPVITLEPAH